MKPLRPLCLALLMLLPLLPLHLHAAQQEWRGDYVYTASKGSTKGGSPITGDYLVSLTGGSDAPACKIAVSGFQTDEEIVCSVQRGDNSISLQFKSYKSGDIKNAHGVAVYQPGQTLLILERATVNGRTTLITRWQGLKGLDGKIPASGEAFRPVTPKP